ncbi:MULTISPECIES: DUF5794 domain-containing protein [Halorussus]|uniref:DUF5794 domain-containing protein n=1 Tax=Halorussus TaxID=1070314 RepID=UPI0020A0AC8A|nr:DUF5794 domain-containing protein [Halorussus vallis]USZ76183.1 DUF5794 domain-containing protein [Halorussus vallis]
MSSSEHPVALSLERQVGGATKLLATVMGLPLVDGIFPALVLAGALDSTVGMVQVGLLVFGGSATVAVILAEMDGSRREQITSVLLVGVGLVALASVEAWLAPTIESALDPKFKRFAALVIAAIAAKTASSRIGEILPRPAVIVGLGFVACLQPAGFHIGTVDYELVWRAAAAAGSGVAFALAVAMAGPHLRGVVDIDRFRFGSSVALGLLALTVVFPMPGHAPLAVLVVTALLAFDPGSADADLAETDDDNASEAAATAAADSTVDPSAEDVSARADAGDAGADGTSVGRLAKRKAAKARTMATDGAGDESDSPGYGYPGEESTDEREPWL